MAESQRYTRVKKLQDLGRGRKVYLMKSNETDDDMVVIKVYSKDLIKKRKITREIEKWKECVPAESIRLLKLTDVIEDSRRVYLVSEYCANGDLSRYIGRNFNNLEIPARVHILHKIAQGIAELHRAGICHLDIKLENILVTGDEPVDIRICDFEFAEKKEIIDRACGTPYYVPPELAGFPKKVKFAGKPSDIWSFGVVMYCVMTEHYPFDGITRAIVTHRIKKSKLLPPRDPSRVPPEMWEIICGALQKKSEDRWTIEKILDEFTKLLEQKEYACTSGK